MDKQRLKGWSHFRTKCREREREREVNNKLQMLLVSYSGENIGFHALLEIHDHASKKPNNQHQMLVK